MRRDMTTDARVGANRCAFHFFFFFFFGGFSSFQCVCHKRLQIRMFFSFFFTWRENVHPDKRIKKKKEDLFHFTPSPNSSSWLSFCYLNLIIAWLVNHIRWSYLCVHRRGRLTSASELETTVYSLCLSFSYVFISAFLFFFSRNNDFLPSTGLHTQFCRVCAFVAFEETIETDFRNPHTRF